MNGTFRIKTEMGTECVVSSEAGFEAIRRMNRDDSAIVSIERFDEREFGFQQEATDGAA